MRNSYEVLLQVKDLCSIYFVCSYMIYETTITVHEWTDEQDQIKCALCIAANVHNSHKLNSTHIRTGAGMGICYMKGNNLQ